MAAVNDPVQIVNCIGFTVLSCVFAPNWTETFCFIVQFVSSYDKYLLFNVRYFRFIVAVQMETEPVIYIVSVLITQYIFRSG